MKEKKMEYETIFWHEIKTIEAGERIHNFDEDPWPGVIIKLKDGKEIFLDDNIVPNILRAYRKNIDDETHEEEETDKEKCNWIKGRKECTDNYNCQTCLLAEIYNILKERR
jgi:hypothetical protein